MAETVPGMGLTVVFFVFTDLGQTEAFSDGHFLGVEDKSVIWEESFLDRDGFEGIAVALIGK